MTDARRNAPATARNRDPLAAVLREVLPHHGTVLEVASGTGEHAVYFARLFPHLRWQPSAPDPQALAPFVPFPYVVHGPDGKYRLVESGADEDATGQELGRMKAFHGQMGMFVRALTYMLSHGADGLRQASGDAVLNANYVLASLKDVMTAPFEGPCMHEALFDDRFLKDTGVSTLDIAKAMLDEGYHPMTMYFPLVVHGAMLIEPTETKSKATLDQFIAMLRHFAEKAKAGDAAFFTAAPRLTPRRRLDETAAARKPVLRWRPEIQTAEAAE